MDSRVAITAGLLVIGGAQSACRMDVNPETPEAPQAAAPAQPVSGYATDMEAFDAFIATRPTPQEFRAQYPDVMLVMPGTVTTKEFRTNNSRYFARVDEDGRIVGGRFM